MEKKIDRREFLKLVGAGSAGLVLASCAPTAAPEAPAAEPTAAPVAEATAVPAVEPTAVPTVAPTATPEPVAAEPKILKVRLYGDLQNMDPAFLISQNDNVVAYCVCDSLVRYGPNSYDIVNQLAETIEQSEDGLTITFKLREGVQWHEGYGEVTTEDVKFSYERMIDPELKAEYADDWKTLDRVEIVDKYNGKIILKEPFAPLWTTTLPVGSGMIICKKYVEEVGLDRYKLDIIGCGPYLFDTWEPKSKTILKRNPDYYGGTPAWDEIHFFPIEDDKAGEVAIEAGEVDFSRISVASIPRFEGNADLGTIKLPSLRFRWIGMNVEHPKFQDIRVRQAVRYGIDVPSIVQAAYMGQAEQETTLVAPGLIGHWAEAPVHTRDVEKAKALLAEAGVTSLDVKMDIQDTTEYRTWAEIAQQNLAEVGINVTINPMDSASFWTIGEGDKGKELEMFSNNYSMQPDASWATVWFTCPQVGIWNWQRWCSQEYDDLHNKGLVTLDNAERQKIYEDMEKIMDDDCHSIWISHGVSSYSYKPTIKPAVTPHGVPQVEWFVPA